MEIDARTIAVIDVGSRGGLRRYWYRDLAGVPHLSVADALYVRPDGRAAALLERVARRVTWRAVLGRLVRNRPFTNGLHLAGETGIFTAVDADPDW